jgi:hypothetical protein
MNCLVKFQLIKNMLFFAAENEKIYELGNKDGNTIAQVAGNTKLPRLNLQITQAFCVFSTNIILPLRTLLRTFLKMTPNSRKCIPGIPSLLLLDGKNISLEK